MKILYINTRTIRRLFVAFFAIIATLHVQVADGQAKSNPYGLDNEVYNYYKHCLNYAKNNRILAMADSMRTIAKRKHDVKGECIALNLKTRYYLTANNIDSIRYHKEIVHKFASKTPYTAYIFSAWNCVIQYYLDLGDYTQVLNEASQYQREAIRLKSDYGIGQSYRVMGETYTSTGDYLQAINQFKLAADYYSKKKDPNLYECYNSLANCYYQLRQYMECEKYAQLSLNCCNVETLQSTARIYLTIAACKQINRSKACTYMNELTQLRDKLHHFFPANEDRYAEAQIEYNILLGNYEKALSWSDSLKGNINMCRYKSLIYEASGDYKNALKMNVNSQQKLDSLRRLENANKVSLYSQQFHNMKLMADKNQLELQNAKYSIANMKSERLLIQSDKAKSELRLKNIQLELNNKNLEIRQHEAEALLKHNEIEKEKRLRYVETREAKMELRQRNLWLVIGGILLFVALLALVVRMRYTMHVMHERDLANKARKEAEEAKWEAQKANNLKTEFLNNMSHEIRTPLNAIVGFTDILNGDIGENLSATEKEEFLNIIHTNTNLLTTLINDLLDLSRMQTGNYKLKVETFNIADLCKNAVNSVMSRVPEGVGMILEDTNNCDSIIVKNDRVRLTQVITNLLTNACKYTEHGKITLGYELKEDGMVNITVSDTGCGIPKEDADKIFNRFEKLGSFKQGTGIGLNICATIAELMKGNIWLDTTYTNGCRFVFSIPKDI